MNELVLFYLITSATHILPLTIVALSLIYGTPFPFLSNILQDQPPVNRAVQNIGIARLGYLFQFFDPEMREYLIQCGLTVLSFQISTVIFVTYAILYDIPLPFIPESDFLPQGFTFTFLMFWTTTGVMELIPVLFLILAVLYDVPLPFMPPIPEIRTPSNVEILDGEDQSQDLAWIRLSRFEHTEKTFIYINCRSEVSDRIIKLVLCRGREVGARTDCYLYDEDAQTIERILPTPFTVNEIEEILNPHNE